MSSRNGIAMIDAPTIRREFAAEGVHVGPLGAVIFSGYERDGAAASGLDLETVHGIPAGPDPAAPATHQAWEEVMDARNAIQHLESKAQEYAAGLYEPEDITDADRRTMRLYILAARACLTAAERLFGLV